MVIQPFQFHITYERHLQQNCIDEKINFYLSAVDIGRL